MRNNRNNYETVAEWEKSATHKLPVYFGLEVAKYFDDDKTENHDNGTDVLIKNFLWERYKRVDFKWSRFLDYKEVWLALEDVHVNGTSWTTNQKAIDLDVAVVAPFKQNGGYVTLCAYRLKDLATLAEEKRKSHIPTSEAKGTGTRYWKVCYNELLPYLMWESRPVSVDYLKLIFRGGVNNAKS